MFLGMYRLRKSKDSIGCRRLVLKSEAVSQAGKLTRIRKANPMRKPSIFPSRERHDSGKGCEELKDVSPG